MPVECRAWAKVNLTLHVTGQRADGYHLLDSLVVRAGIGDLLRVTPAAGLRLRVDGPTSAGVPDDERNLVLRAARFLDRGAGRGAALHLIKYLPAAAGIGGGSADAAAALRALSEFWQVPLPADLAALGADVPVCLSQQPQRMQGVGETLVPVVALPPCWLVLVNPGIAVSTPAVFAALQDKEQPPMPAIIPMFADAAALAGWLATQRNDLEQAALSLVPQIADCLRAMPDALLARMSGSGATCFGLYPTAFSAARAAARLHADHPKWWVADAPVIN